MSVHEATPGSGAGTPEAPSARPYAPGAPAAAGARDLRSRALLPALHAPSGGASGGMPGDGADGGPDAESQAELRQGHRRAAARPADPVRELMHRHREVCERAVDPLEIAAHLEVHGVTDRTAARYRHRDVFSLAEELFARVPRAEGHPPDVRARCEAAAKTGTTADRTHGARGEHGARGRRAARTAGAALLVLLPGVLTGAACALFVLADVRSEGAPARVVFQAVSALLVVASVRLVLRRVVHAAPRLPAILAACWLAGCAVFGELAGVRPDGPSPDGAWPDVAGGGVTAALSLACAVVPAAWCARWFAVRARRRLEGSRSLEEFAASVRPLLAAAVILFAVALLAVQTVVAETAARVAPQAGAEGRSLTGPLIAVTALGVLFFVALLLTAHGFHAAAAAGLAAACAMDALASAAPAAAPAVLSEQGVLAPFAPGLLPAVGCGCVALGLLVKACRVLTGASAHRRAHHDRGHRTDREAGETPGGDAAP